MSIVLRDEHRSRLRMHHHCPSIGHVAHRRVEAGVPVVARGSLGMAAENQAKGKFDTPVLPVAMMVSDIFT